MMCRMEPTNLSLVSIENTGALKIRLALCATIMQVQNIMITIRLPIKETLWVYS